MIQTINSYDFHRAFNELRPAHFSYDALDLLFEHFESIEEDTGEQIELDVIAICCEYSEDSINEIIENYSVYISDCDSEEEIKKAAKQFLLYNTSYIGETELGLVYQQF